LAGVARAEGQWTHLAPSTLTLALTFRWLLWPMLEVPQDIAPVGSYVSYYRE
jgi:hypothetical protein